MLDRIELISLTLNLADDGSVSFDDGSVSPCFLSTSEMAVSKNRMKIFV